MLLSQLADFTTAEYYRVQWNKIENALQKFVISLYPKIMISGYQNTPGGPGY